MPKSNASLKPAILGMIDYSLIIPVYRNEGSIAELLDAMDFIQSGLDGALEVVFVVDGSPDRSHERLLEGTSGRRFRSKIVLLSRNFGSFAAIREGLLCAKGDWLAVMAADLQEPPELMLEFFQTLRREPVDVVVGTRAARSDPWLDRWASKLFWGAYRALVQPEVPKGGIDVFGCNRAFRDQLVRLNEVNSSLVGQVIWLGFRRREIPYERRERRHGRSAWTFSRKLKYLMDSIFSFSDFPIRLLFASGAIGLVVSVGVGALVSTARLLDWIRVPGYAATLLVILFFAALNLLGLGILGAYVWRAFENTKQRPSAVVLMTHEIEASKAE